MRAKTHNTKNNNAKNNTIHNISVGILRIIVSIVLLLTVCGNHNGKNHQLMQNSVIAVAIAAAATTTILSPAIMAKQSYKLIQKTKLSHDSFLLRFGLPNNNRRSILGVDPLLPTCIKIDYPNPMKNNNNADDDDDDMLSKSYSPISHPSTKGYFELVVKSYKNSFYHEGGGVGKYLCDLTVGRSINGEVKKERIMHGSSQIVNRGWNHIGLIAGGTGIAPLLQLARILLFEKDDDNDEDEDEDKEQQCNNTDANTNTNTGKIRPKIHLLFINHAKEDILGRNEIETLAKKHPNNFFVTYLFTQEHEDEENNDGEESQDKYLQQQQMQPSSPTPQDRYSDASAVKSSSLSSSSSSHQPSITFLYGRGRGDVDMVKQALPLPSKGDATTMIFVCGRDGFVEYWAGPVTRDTPLIGKKKGKKIQGPLLGVLKASGYTASQVFKY